jgi:protease I
MWGAWSGVMNTKSSRGRLSGKTIAILATDGFEQSELLKPRELFEKEGAKTVVVSQKKGDIQGMNHAEKGEKVAVDATLGEAKADAFDALVLPGGVANPDALRVDPKAVAFVKDVARAGKPIGAICHGPWTLIEADLVRGRKMTSWPSLKTDLTNAGAKWVDEEVVSDRGLVTSRKPADIPSFVDACIEAFTQKATRSA